MFSVLRITIVYFASTIEWKRRHPHEDYDVCPFGYLFPVMPLQGPRGVTFHQDELVVQLAPGGPCILTCHTQPEV